MLELRSSCERCDAPLPSDALDARICSYECTFCAACTDAHLGGRCPNCSGELIARPTRATDAGSDVTHPGVVLRRYADAWRQGDLDTLLDCYDDGFTLHNGGASRFAGTHVGKDAAVGAMAELSTIAPRELVAIDHVLVDDDGGALVVTETLRRDDADHTMQRLLRYRVAGGRLVECWLYESDQALVDHLWRPST